MEGEDGWRGRRAKKRQLSGHVSAEGCGGDWDMGQRPGEDASTEGEMNGCVDGWMGGGMEGRDVPLFTGRRGMASPVPPLCTGPTAACASIEPQPLPPGKDRATGESMANPNKSGGQHITS